MHAAASWRGSRRISPRATAAGRASSSDAESERYLLFGAVVDLLARVSALAPVVLVLDDLHWADRPTIQLLRHVVSADAPLRLFVIGTFRESDIGTDHPLAEALAALHRESGVERLALRGLGDDELLVLLETTAGHAMADEGVALRDALLAETDGNPFFVGEMLRHLAETRAIYQDEQGRWVASADLRTSGLPVSIREVIGRRVARLGASTRDVLSMAAVIGRDFDADVLARVTELDEDTLIDLCDQAVTAAVLTEADVAGRYTFAHALIEHTLYDESLCRPAGARPPAGRGGARGALWRRSRRADRGARLPLGSRHDPRTRARRSRTRNGRAIGPWPSSRPTRRCAGTGMRSICSIGPRSTTRTVGPRCSSGSATRNDRPVIPRTARRCSRPAASPTTSTRSTSSCAPRCGTTEAGTASPAGSTTSASRCSTRALARLGDADSPDRARLLALLCVERTVGRRFRRTPLAGDPSRRHGAAHRRQRRVGRRDPAVPRVDHDAPDPRAPPPMEHRGVRPRRRSRRPDRTPVTPTTIGASRHWRPATLRPCGSHGPSSSRNAERIGQPLNRWLIAFHGARQSMLEGDLDAAEQSATEALTLGTAAGYPDDAVTFYGAQLMGLRWMQGRSTR